MVYELFSRLNVFKCDIFLVLLYQLENVHKTYECVFHKALLYINY